MAGQKLKSKSLNALIQFLVFLSIGLLPVQEVNAKACRQKLVEFMQLVHNKFDEFKHLHEIKKHIQAAVRKGEGFELGVRNRTTGDWVLERINDLHARILLKNGINRSDSIEISESTEVYRWSDFQLPSKINIQQLQLEVEIERARKTILSYLAYPGQWAVGREANSRREYALTVFQGFVSEEPKIPTGGVKALEFLREMSPSSYDKIVEEILAFVKKYFLMDSPPGESVLLGNRNPEDQFVIENDAAKVLQHLYEVTGDPRLHPGQVVSPEIPVDPNLKTEEAKMREKALQNQAELILKLGLRLGAIEEAAAKKGTEDKEQAYLRELVFSVSDESVVSDILTIQQAAPRDGDGLYPAFRAKLINFIKRNFGSRALVDSALQNSLKKFSIDIGDANLDPSRLFPRSE